jgi:serine/threonine protein kinase
MAKTYGKWEVIESIGEGGQAHILKVRRTDRPDDREYALKRVRNRERLGRFEREIGVVRAKLRNKPGIIWIVDADLTGEKPFLVMPYYPRGNAKDAGVLKWPIEDRFEFFLGILEAMQKAHGNKITHRDLKPENILVDDEKRPVVSDFGICFVEGGERFTVTGEVVGSRGFSAPEIEAGREDLVSPRSDVYSLGKLLYWICCGSVPPRESHREQRYELHRHDPRFELVSELLDQMITEDPKQRFPSAGSVESGLRQKLEWFKRVSNYPSGKLRHRCQFCGLGTYALIGSP